MMMSAQETTTATPELAEPRAGLSGDRALRLLLGVIAAVLVVLSAKAPVWEMKLTAPQYPKGLLLTAYGDRVDGDVGEINELNHYVGLGEFNIADVPERKLWLPAIGAALVAVIVGSVLPRKHWLGRLARIGLWLVPIGALVAIQYRLYLYGHDIDAGAPIHLDPFMPLVVGPTQVLNFHTSAMPGTAVWLLSAAAFLVMFGPGIVRRVRQRMARSAEERAAAGAEGGEAPAAAASP